MLTNWEWADRLGIPVNFVSAAAPNSRYLMGYLTLWRWGEFTEQGKWCGFVDNACNPTSGPMGPGGIQRYGSDVASYFWQQLRHKKEGLYGTGTSVKADPLALARHPWSLKKQEFAAAYSSILDGDVPDIKNDRQRYTDLTAVSGAPAGAAAGVLVSGPALPFVLGGIGIYSVAGIAADYRSDFISDLESKHILEKIPKYQEIYRKEADYRGHETLIAGES